MEASFYSPLSFLFTMWFKHRAAEVLHDQFKWTTKQNRLYFHEKQMLLLWMTLLLVHYACIIAYDSIIHVWIIDGSGVHSCVTYEALHTVLRAHTYYLCSHKIQSLFWLCIHEHFMNMTSPLISSQQWKSVHMHLVQNHTIPWDSVQFHNFNVQGSLQVIATEHLCIILLYVTKEYTSWYVLGSTCWRDWRMNENGGHTHLSDHSICCNGPCIRSSEKTCYPLMDHSPSHLSVFLCLIYYLWWMLQIPTGILWFQCIWCVLSTL